MCALFCRTLLWGAHAAYVVIAIGEALLLKQVSLPLFQCAVNLFVVYCFHLISPRLVSGLSLNLETILS